MNEEDKDSIRVIIGLLKDFFGDEEKVKTWLDCPNLNFGGATPTNLFLKGRANKVLLFVKNARDENSR